MEKVISGAKGGSGGGKNSSRSTEIASVAYMKILLALSEGEIAGGFTGKDIYLDGTPLLDDNGSENFPGVVWDWRPGTISQDYIAGFPAVENEIGTSYEIKYGTPWMRSITNTQLSAVRLRLKFPNGLYRMTDSGSKKGYKVDFLVELSTDGSTYKEVGRDSASGIADSGYERSYRIDLPAAKSGWNIRVTRLTSNSTDGRHADTTRIESMTEIVDAKLSYPNTALLFVQFDSKLFDGKTPTVTVKTRGMVIRVPTNYNPETRQYAGTWDGQFKWAWTNNPAWIFLDILTNKRYGLGKRITLEQVDKWTLYKIAQYCDAPVSDGAGGTEPRFLCDLYLSRRTDAWTVLMDLANIFRGMIGWSNNLLTIDADMPRALDPDFVFNKSNIVGSFTFSSTSEKSNYSAAIVTYSNPANHYSDDQASVYVRDLSTRFGFNVYEMTAVGCTRDSDGQRRGIWAVETNRDDNAVEFKTGQEGRIPRVGGVIGISNGRQTGRANGGRISAVAGNKLTLDRMTTAKVGDTLIVNLPSGVAQSRTLSAVSGRAVTVSKAFTEVPVVEAAWVLNQSDLVIQQFRVKRVIINDDKTVTINGIAYNPAKYAAIDNGAIIDTPPVTVVPPRGQQAPTNIIISSSYRVEQGIGITTMEVAWDRVKNAVAYEAQWRQDSGEWINVPRTGNNRFSVDGIYAGAYVVRIRAINAFDIASVWGVSVETQLAGKVGKPPAPVGLTATGINWGIKLTWGFPAGTQDTQKTEIQYSAGADFSTPLLLSDVPYPSAEYTQAGLLAGKEFWYRARLVDRIGNVSDWTSVIRGMANDQASDYLDAIKDQVLLAADGKALTEKIDFSIAGVLQGTLANIQGAKVSFEQFGIARAEISQAQELIADAKQSYAEFKDLVAVQFGDSAAEILTVRKAQATTDSAMALLTTTVQATTQSVDALTGRVIHAEASVVSISEAQTTTEEALATFEQQTTATFDKQQSAINQKFTAYADATSANAIYTLKAGVQYNGNYYNAGISVAVIANGSSVSTRVAINANELVMLSGSSTSQMYSPFAIVSGQVFLNDAFIQNGTITSAKIADAAITNAKIANAAITNAKISGDLWSANFVSGMFGWIVRQDGSAEFNNVLIRGIVEADEFVGDVANGQVFPDTGISSTVSVAFTYTDSGTKLRDKHIVLMAMISVGGATGPGATGGAADVTLTIGNVSKTYRVVNATDRGPLFTTLMVSARVRARSVACSITGKTGGISSGGSCQILSPSVIVARGSGAFEQTS